MLSLYYHNPEQKDYVLFNFETRCGNTLQALVYKNDITYNYQSEKSRFCWNPIMGFLSISLSSNIATTNRTLQKLNIPYTIQEKKGYLYAYCRNSDEVVMQNISYYTNCFFCDLNNLRSSTTRVTKDRQHCVMLLPNKFIFFRYRRNNKIMMHDIATVQKQQITINRNSLTKRMKMTSLNKLLGSIQGCFSSVYSSHDKLYLYSGNGETSIPEPDSVYQLTEIVY